MLCVAVAVSKFTTSPSTHYYYFINISHKALQSSGSYFKRKRRYLIFSIPGGEWLAFQLLVEVNTACVSSRTVNT